MLSEDVKMYMYLPTAKRYYVLNDRTINLLMKGNVGMSATTGGSGVSYNRISISDLEADELVKKETEVELFTIEEIRQEQVDHSLNILILLYLIYLNMAF